MDMKCKVYDKNELQNINVSFGTKNGYSPYLVSKTGRFHELSDIIGFFNQSTLDMAVKETIKDYMGDITEVFLLTGDGQIIRISKEK